MNLPAPLSNNYYPASIILTNCEG